MTGDWWRVTSDGDVTSGSLFFLKFVFLGEKGGVLRRDTQACYPFQCQASQKLLAFLIGIPLLSGLFWKVATSKNN